MTRLLTLAVVAAAVLSGCGSTTAEEEDLVIITKGPYTCVALEDSALWCERNDD